MKKYFILILAVTVCWMGFSYRKHMRVLRGEELATDAYYGDLLSVKNDVEQGAPVGYRFTFDDDERQYTRQTFNALHAASSSGNEDVILFLLDQGLPIDSRTPEGWTPLFVAARDGQSEAAKLLVFKGADLNAQTNLGATALMMAVTQDYPSEKARLDLIEYMIKRGADVQVVDKYGHSALYYAQMKDNSPVAELLLEYEVAKKS